MAADDLFHKLFNDDTYKKICKTDIKLENLTKSSNFLQSSTYFFLIRARRKWSREIRKWRLFINLEVSVSVVPMPQNLFIERNVMSLSIYKFIIRGTIAKYLLKLKFNHYIAYHTTESKRYAFPITALDRFSLCPICQIILTEIQG